MGIIDLKPDLEVVERWMRQWPGLPVVVGIRIDTDTWLKGLVEGKCFIKPGCPADGNPDHTDYIGMRRWIWERQGGGAYWANIYFHPNSLRRAIDNKAKAADVGAMTTLHVDCDNAPGENQETGIARNVELLKKLRGADGNIIMPSDIITSGGGAQAYWRLGAPIPILSEDDLEKLKLYNKHIESELRGDHCHSLDHIMRMPGTINIPHAEKRAKGRLPRLATWEFHDASTRYSLNQFVAAAPENKATVARAFAKDGDDVKFTAESISPTDERLKGLSDKWIKIGREGDGKTDRSGTALAFVTACMRCSPPVSDEVIASILMDKDWAIGECIRDKGATVSRHRNRIIERAHKFVAEDVEKPMVVNTSKWDETADRFLVRYFPEGLVYWRDDFYPYTNGVYPMVSEATIMAKIYAALCAGVENVSMKIKDENGKPAKDDKGKTKLDWDTQPYHPNKNDCAEMMFAVKQKCKLADDIEQPCFLRHAEDYPPPRECLNLHNGFLHVPTRTLLDHTSDYFTSSIASFNYTPEAKCPVWLSTLAEYWPEATALEPTLLKQMFGYSLTPWTTLQKLLAVVGPGRSGKGTIARVLTLLVGKENIAAPTFKSLGTDFGRQALINKLLAIVGEAAFGARDDKAEITNFLKTVSGEDTVNIQRKYLSDWEGRMIARFWLFCNQIPDFLDAGKALMARIVPLKMTRSFADNPDTTLGERLEAEISGILNWALEGYRELREAKGVFTMPQASTETKELFGSLASPASGFLEDYCVMWDMKEKLPEDCWTSRDDLYLAYQNWCQDVGVHALRLSKAMEAMLSLEPARLKMVKKLAVRGVQNRFWAITGLTLKEKPVRREHGSYGARGGRRGGPDTAASSSLAEERDRIPF